MYADGWLFRLCGVSRELAYLETDKEQRAAWTAVSKRTRHTARYVVVYIGIVVIAAAGASLGFDLFVVPMRLPIYPLVLKCITFSVVGIAPALGSLWYSRAVLRRKLWDYLTEQGVPVCRKCGYNLTGNTSGCCPECGQAVNVATSGTSRDSAGGG